MVIPTITDLPLVIHGKEGSGASHFSVQLIAEMAKNKMPITFWSAYPMAKDELRKALDGNVGSDLHIIESGDFAELYSALKETEGNTVLFVKNFEVVPKEVREKVLGHKLLVVSGDMEEILTQDQVLNFPNRIFFSPYPGIEIPSLEKYQGYMFSEDKNEIVTI